MKFKLCLSTIIITAVILITTGCNSASNERDGLVSGKGISASKGMIASAHPLASQVGARILEQGGNAFDAAVAVHFALAVVYPGAGNVAGGGFVVYRLNDGKTGCLDFREKAPKEASRNMYLDKDDEAISGLSSFGPLSVGVPGSVDGMIRLHMRLGSMPFDQLIQPAIDLAEKGYHLTKREAGKLNSSQEAILLANDSSTFFYNGGKWKEGDIIKNLQLANTLKLIRDKGRDGFYSGETARNLINELSQKGGIISQSDLNDYNSVWRDPVVGTYKQFKIITMPPPSSGGVAIMQLLKGSENYDFQKYGHNSAMSVHIMTELERRVYADRATYLGDPDYYDVPLKMLLDNAYLEKRFSDINLSSKTDSRDIKEGSVDVIESTETTHFSIVDKDHNAIAVTTTLNGIFGSKVYVEKSGFFLNNEMDDFSIKPDYPNQFGLVGGEANAIGPEKRMLSSMAPTIVEKDDRLFLVVGTPGGSTIITSVYQTILNMTEYGMDIQQAINAKKTHSQWLPDLILYETDGLDSTEIIKLMKLGHTLKNAGSLGRINAVEVLPDGTLLGGSDPRGDDTAVGVR